MAVFLFIAHEKGFKFLAQPQTGVYSCSCLGLGLRLASKDTNSATQH